MLLSMKRRFVFIANLKTASTSIERILAPYADIALVQSRFGKHMGLTEVLDSFPFVFDEEPFANFVSFAVVRDPVDRLYSLYRSHKGGRFAGDPKLSTADLSFSQFLREWLVRNPEQAVSQTSMLRDDRGRAALARLIRFDDLPTAFPPLARKLAGNPWRPYRLPRINASGSAADPAISAEDRRTIEEVYADDLALYERAGP